MLINAARIFEFEFFANPIQTYTLLDIKL